jgi:hypothetical protein
MPTKIAVAALAVAVTALAGCQGDQAAPAQSAPTQAAAPAVSSAPASPAPADNGIASLEADEILKRAKTALKEAGSFRAKGSGAADGQDIAIDLRVSGKDFAGTMTMEKAEVELLAVKGKKYLRPSKEFWVMSTDARQGEALAEVIGDRWVTGADKDESFAELFAIGSVDEMLKPTGALSKGGKKVIGGVPAIGLKDAGDPDSVLYVATTGEPYPLRMVGKDKSGLTFSDIGETFSDIKAPAAKQVVDLGKLSGA